MHERRILKRMDAGIIIVQGETLLGHAAMQHDERLRLVALLYSLISFFICLFLVFFLSPFLCRTFWELPFPLDLS